MMQLIQSAANPSSPAVEVKLLKSKVRPTTGKTVQHGMSVTIFIAAAHG